MRRLLGFLQARPLALAAALALVAGCGGSDLPDDAVQARTSAPAAVDAESDNAPVVGSLVEGLVVTLEILDGEVSLVRGRIMLIPRQPARERGEDSILLRGLRGTEEIVVAAVPGEELNVEEGVGLVRLRERTVSAALPVPAPIDRLLVELTPGAAPWELDVRPIFAEHCRERPHSRLCPAG